MKPRLLSSRPCVTRTSRRDPRGAALESVAAEFALLAQRRARLARQLDLLGRQLDAATTSLDAVQSRMAQIAQRIDAMDPTLRPSIAQVSMTPPFAPGHRAPRGAAEPTRFQTAAMYQATPPPHQDGIRKPHALGLRAPRPFTRQRPFLPE